MMSVCKKCKNKEEFFVILLVVVVCEPSAFKSEQCGMKYWYKTTDESVQYSFSN